MKNNILDVDTLESAAARIRAWSAWLQRPNELPNPYFNNAGGKQDSGRVMEAEIADVGVLCDAAQRMLGLSQESREKPALAWKEGDYGEMNGYLREDLSTTLFIIKGDGGMGGACTLSGAFIPDDEKGAAIDAVYTLEGAQKAAEEYLDAWVEKHVSRVAIGMERMRILLLVARALPHVEMTLASQGDRADPVIVKLQHDMAAAVRVAEAR